MRYKTKSLKFIVDVPMVFFSCSYAVYPKGGNSSVCYCTSREGANFIANALNKAKIQRKDVEEMTKWKKK
jgi:hypothetical protein